MAAWRIGEMLIQKKLISWQDLEDGLEEQKKTREFLGEVLVRKKKLHLHFLYRALAEQCRLSYVDLQSTRISPQAVRCVPGSIARKYSVMPIEVDERTLVVAVTNPLARWPGEELKKLAKMDEIKMVLCLPAAVEKAIAEHYDPDVP